jgi:hypothetical protein
MKFEKYHPIANLHITLKKFKKLILKQIQYMEITNSLDLIGKQQHGLKSMAIAGL